ncbi:G1/S-specific cyclin-E1-like isoform X3 [Biomphalaria glabrata]|uniref:G1/S-specific cyclin-E1-like isoform X3 n=1 Tax=Biomphalaria glabrata TaxID=6526 RepID=A0A9W3AXK2_BIOGL|nr:G1/S-specific cyclin-E1-like isoform X3 [Biomphalaria glabrata]
MADTLNRGVTMLLISSPDSSPTESQDYCCRYCQIGHCENKEKHLFENWVSPGLEPPSGSSSTEDEVDGYIENPSQGTNSSFEEFRSLKFQVRFRNLFTTAPNALRCPLPCFNWADSNEVWTNMLKKELTFQKDCGLFENHPELQPRMRSILLDWLSEVCEVYRLHKETFALAIDFIDRYLSVTKNIPKTQLQLIGISALFVAAKLEEIYPPKLTEFAYVTDSACSESEIIRQEMILVKALKWNLSPMTANAWLGVYLQVANIDHIQDQELGFVFPQYSTHAFIQISRLCDLSLMDVGSLNFRYSVIAASALYHHTNEELVMEVTGYNWADLYPCIKWMAPFARAILDVGQSPIKFFQNINAEDCHNIQTHNVDMALVDRAAVHQAAYKEKEKESPTSLDLSAQLVGLLTPPANKTRPTEEFTDEEPVSS